MADARPVRGLAASEHIANIHSKCQRYSLHVVERDIAFAALDRTHIGSVQLRQIGQALLR